MSLLRVDLEALEALEDSEDREDPEHAVNNLLDSRLSSSSDPYCARSAYVAGLC